MNRSHSLRRVPLELGEADLDQGVLRGPARDLVRLTPKERALLAFLVAREGQTIDRQTLLEQVWGYAPDVVSRAVDKTMARLRSKVERVPAAPRHLISVPGEGYRFEPLSSPRAVEAPQQHPTSHLFGRAELLASLRSALAAGPGTWTLHGPGGVGKTSIVRALLDGWSGPTTVAWLADCRDAESVEATLGAALGSSGRRGWAAALAQLEGGLLILDNAEQVESAVAALLPELMEGGPGVRIVVTSRTALQNLPGVQTVEVPPLKAGAARDLLVARAHQRGAAVNPSDLTSLVEVLDGLPLALELAAARLAHASAAELCRRLPHRLGILRSAGREREGRHHSVEAAMEWSWELLSTHERTTLARCAVFRGGFSLAAAEAVLGDAAAWEVLPELVRASLVQRANSRLGTRFSMHHLVQAFVEAQMGVGADVRSAHAGWYARCARKWSRDVHSPESAAAWNQLSLERANLAHAFDAACEAELSAVAMDLAAGLQALLRTRGPVARWHRLTGRLVSLTEAGAPALHAQALVFRGVARLASGDLAASATDLEQGRTLALAADAPEVAAMASIRLAFVRDACGQEGAAALLTEASALAEQNGLERVRALAAGDRGIHLWRRGRFAEAESSFATGERLFARAGDAVQQATTAVNRGHNARARADSATATICFQRAVQLAGATGYRRVAAVAHLELADLSLLGGDPDAALQHLASAEAHGVALGSPELRGVAEARRVVATQLHTPRAEAALRAARDRLAQVDTQAAEGTWLGLALHSLLAPSDSSRAAWRTAAVDATTDPAVKACIADPSAPLPATHLDRADMQRWQWAAGQFRGAAGQSTAES